jgi:hypothetical protein
MKRFIFIGIILLLSFVFADDVRTGKQFNQAMDYIKNSGQKNTGFVS